nr:hypothetical protein [Tanacetum cinerariifolium]
MVLYNALPEKEYERIFMCDTAKDLWNSLKINHQEELIGNLKVYEVVLENDLEISKNNKEKYKSLDLKARKVLSEEESTSSDNNDEEYAMAVKDFKKYFKIRGKFVRQPHDNKKNFRKVKDDKKKKDNQSCFKCGDPNHFISDCPKHSFNDQKAFVVECWSDSKDDSKKEEICLMAHDDNEVFSDTPYYSSSSLDNESWENEYDKVLSEEEATFSDINDEEYAMAVKDFKKYFKRRGKFVRQPHDDKKNFWKVKEDKKKKDDRRCFKCGDPNHFISDCPKHSFNDQKAFIVGCCSDNEDDSKKEGICLMAHDDNEVFSDTPYYSSSYLDNES